MSLHPIAAGVNTSTGYTNVAEVVTDFPGLRDYAAAVSPTTEAPLIFHVGGFLAIAGHAIGTGAEVNLSGPVFASDYLALVGPPGGPRKTTSIGYARRLHEAALDPQRLIAGGGSAEGLVDLLNEFTTLVLVPGELRGLLEKGRQTGVANLIPFITDVYDTPATYSLKTRGKPITLQRPLLSILTATTPRWMGSVLGDDAIGGGLVSRFMWLAGEAGEPIALPPAPEPRALGDAVASIKALTQHKPGALAWTPDAVTLWETEYLAWRRRLAVGDEIATAAVVRTHLHALKIAMLRCCCSARTALDDADIASGWIVALYAEQVTLGLLGDMLAGREKRIERRIVACITRAGGRAKKRDVQRAVCGGGTTAREYLAALESMVKAEVLEWSGTDLVLVAGGVTPIGTGSTP